jgi:hypothetical protein
MREPVVVLTYLGQLEDELVRRVDVDTIFLQVELMRRVLGEGVWSENERVFEALVVRYLGEEVDFGRRMGAGSAASFRQLTFLSIRKQSERALLLLAKLVGNRVVLNAIEGTLQMLAAKSGGEESRYVGLVDARWGLLASNEDVGPEVEGDTLWDVYQRDVRVIQGILQGLRTTS